MKLTTKDYEIAQDILNVLADIDGKSLPDLTVTATDLERVRGLIQKKLSDFKKVIEGAENHLNEFEFQQVHNEILKSFLIILKNYDIRILELFDVWQKYHKHEMQIFTDLDNALPE